MCGLYVNGQEYSTNPEVSGIDAMHALTSSNGEVMLALDEPVGRQATGRRARRPSRLSGRSHPCSPYHTMYGWKAGKRSHCNVHPGQDVSGHFYTELSSICKNANFEVNDLMGELCANGVPEQDIAQFLIYESNYNEQLCFRCLVKIPDIIRKVRSFHFAMPVMEYAVFINSGQVGPPAGD